MSDKGAAIQVSILNSVRDIGSGEWDRCANPPNTPHNPFLTHAFFSALEESGSASAKKGWLPCHLALKDAAGGLAAVMPCYLKSHSFGEYVFDRSWAAAYERAGGRYYPKLQTAVPFTPVTGRRILVRQDFAEGEAHALLAAAGIEIAKRNRASSWHVTFATKAEWDALGALGLLQRTDTQYHWHNRGYASFEEFLATLASRKRKAIRKEREQACASGLDFEWLTGSDITEAHWDAFFAFYMDTGSRKWGSPYLNRAFFSMIGERMANRVLLIMVKRKGSYVAGALNFIGGDTLYGRYWGCTEYHSFLHFEACYYQAIDYAIANKLAHVEAGAQGEHKLARGYAPEPTYSLHYFADGGLAAAVNQYLQHERLAIIEEQKLMSEALPYKKCG
ncbi:MAG TPA: GNAT family N-acetyltransferase [Hyphomicrobiales bacterium]|nr:GNAT family N-acetyltransferase [Hyphomicrobiales bacterium]